MIIVQIAGHLGADPETRFTPNGMKVTNLRVATTIRRGSKEKTVWWRVTIWGDRFDRKLVHLKKGSAVIVFGELDIPEIYQDRDGNPQISLQITADHLSFSPFGNKTRDGHEAGASPDDEVYEESSSSPAASATQAFNSKATKIGSRTATTTGSRVSIEQDDDDDIPF